jgi:Zinc-binding dehydrogenase
VLPDTAPADERVALLLPMCQALAATGQFAMSHETLLEVLDILPRDQVAERVGADQVIDYTREDFVSSGQRYDVMLDLVGSRSLSDCRRVLTRRGTYVMVGVKDMGRWLGLGRQFKALLLSPFGRQRMRMCVVRHNRRSSSHSEPRSAALCRPARLGGGHACPPVGL